MKKLTLSVLAIVFTFGFSFGQLRELDNGGIPNEDQVPNSRVEQHEAFLDGEYRFPAKPRNMWALGLEAGSSWINGDVKPEFKPFNNFGLNFRKAFGYAFSARFGVNYAMPTGEDPAGDRSYLHYTKARRAGFTGNSTDLANVTYVHSYESTVWMPYLEGVLNLNNINFHREQTDWNFDVSAGGGAYIFDTETTFSNLSNEMPDRTVRLGNSDQTRNAAFLGDDFIAIPMFTVSGGVTYRFSDRVSLGLRPRYVRTFDDWLDGEAYDDTGVSGALDAQYSPDKDQYMSTNLNLNFALGNRDKSVQPLWWENPLNFAYPYLQDEYEFDDEYLFEDSDGDGVVDRMDKEPNSPCSFVDGGGVAIDSDKDGIVDCNDACPFTPAAQIAEIDENGCTELIDKNCCDDIDELRRLINERPAVPTCDSKTYPSITFAKNSRSVASDQNGAIASIASTLGTDPSCRIVIEGFATGRRKLAQQVAWARAKAVADALVDTYGISRDRIIVRYSGVDGYGDVVMVRSARPGEYGESNPAAPAPGTY